MAFGDDAGKAAGGPLNAIFSKAFGRLDELMGSAFGYKFKTPSGAPSSLLNSPSTGGSPYSPAGTKSLLGGSS